MEFKLPDVGEGTTEGEIVRWLVEVGERVSLDQPLVEIQTDKAVVELPAPRAGVIVSRHGEVGQVIAVGTTIVVIEDEAGAVRPSVARKETPSTSIESPKMGVQAAPYTRKIAREAGVDLDTLVGSGPKGRIIPEDVRRATEVEPVALPESVQEVAIRGLRRAVGEHLKQSWSEVPHVTVVEKYDFSELVSVRQDLKERAKISGTRVTYLAFLIKALSMAVGRYPDFNARWQGERLYRHQAIHVGMAVNTEHGLTVPVVRDVLTKSLRRISDDVERLADQARRQRLTSSELTGSTITVTAGGTLGGLFATPIIHAPEVAIVGMYRIQEEPVIRKGAVESAFIGYLSLTFDHRAVDGMIASEFLNDVGDTLAHPSRWLLDLC